MIAANIVRIKKNTPITFIIPSKTGWVILFDKIAISVLERIIIGRAIPKILISMLVLFLSKIMLAHTEKIKRSTAEL